MRANPKSYTSCCSQGPVFDRPDRDSIIWEHGRRYHALRADGVQAIVCPIFDDSPLCGIGVFDAPVEEVTCIMEGDPGVVAGVFTYEVHPVFGFPGGELPCNRGEHSPWPILTTPDSWDCVPWAEPRRCEHVGIDNTARGLPPVPVDAD
jgi:hypothetical protein